VAAAAAASAIQSGTAEKRTRGKAAPHEGQRDTMWGV
jgi:hypothetical protein